MLDRHAARAPMEPFKTDRPFATMVQPSDDPDEDAPRLVRRSTLTPSVKLCPRCLAPLNPRNELGGWLIPQDYYCPKCGYSGTVFLESAEKTGPEEKE